MNTFNVRLFLHKKMKNNGERTTKGRKYNDTVTVSHICHASFFSPVYSYEISSLDDIFFFVIIALYTKNGCNDTRAFVFHVSAY